MGLFDKFKNLVTEDDDYYDDEEYDTEKDGEEDYFGTRKEDKASFSEPVKRPSSVGGNGGIQVVLVKPERFEDAPGIADHLCAKKTVVLNLESASKDSAKRLIDFLSGVAYANKGQIKRVANSTFIITPSNVDVTGDLVLEELENGTMYL